MIIEYARRLCGDSGAAQTARPDSLISRDMGIKYAHRLGGNLGTAQRILLPEEQLAPDCDLSIAPLGVALFVRPVSEEIAVHVSLL